MRMKMKGEEVEDEDEEDWEYVVVEDDDDKDPWPDSIPVMNSVCLVGTVKSSPYVKMTSFGKSVSLR